MNDNLTDQQQAEIVKKWLKDNGLFIVATFGIAISGVFGLQYYCLLYTSPSPRDAHESRMPSSA